MEFINKKIIIIFIIYIIMLFIITLLYNYCRKKNISIQQNYKNKTHDNYVNIDSDEEYNII